MALILKSGATNDLLKWLIVIVLGGQCQKIVENM